MYMKMVELTHPEGRGMRVTVGRKKRWHENLNLTLPAGAKARMDAMLSDGEDRLDLIRDAIERELERREQSRADKPAKDDSPKL